MESVPVEESIPSPESQPVIRSASELREGDRVVYPNQGVCRVQGTESKEIAGSTLTFVSMTREEDNATILVPVAKIESIGLRKVAGSVEIEDVFDLLASSFEDPELDWKVRHRHHVDLLAAGEILGVAEVVKALQGIANLRPLPQRERERYDAARRLLEDEISVALGIPVATAEDLIDFALIPPPGTTRAPRKPRRLAEIPVRPKSTRPKRRPTAEGEEEEFETLEEDLELEAPLDEELVEEEETGAEEEEFEAHEEEEEEEAPKKPARKAAAKPKPAEKAPPKRAAKAEAAKVKAEPKAEAKPKAAKTKAESEAEAKPKAAKTKAEAQPRKATAARTRTKGAKSEAEET